MNNLAHLQTKTNDELKEELKQLRTEEWELLKILRQNSDRQQEIKRILGSNRGVRVGQRVSFHDHAGVQLYGMVMEMSACYVKMVDESGQEVKKRIHNVEPAPL